MWRETGAGRYRPCDARCWPKTHVRRGRCWAVTQFSSTFRRGDVHRRHHQPDVHDIGGGAMAEPPKQPVNPYDFARDVGERLETLVEERAERFSLLLTATLGHPPSPWAARRSLFCTARFALEMVAEGLELPPAYYAAFLNGSGDAFNEVVGDPEAFDDASGREFWDAFRVPVMLDWNRAELELFARHVGLAMPQDARGLDALRRALCRAAADKRSHERFLRCRFRVMRPSPC